MVDKIRLGRVLATIDESNAWGFGTEMIVGSKGPVTLEGGQVVWMRVDKKLKWRPAAVLQPGQWRPDDQFFDTRRVEVTMEFNPSRMMFPNQHDGGLPTTLLHPLLEKMPNQVLKGLGLSSVDLLHPAVKLLRIDLARDFTLSGRPAPDVFEGIRRTPWRYRPTLKLYNKAGEPDNTLECERGAYNIKLYDQKLLHGADFPTDLRCEMNVKRSKYPKCWDLSSPDTWTPSNLTRVFRDCFLKRVPYGARTPVGQLDLDRGELRFD